MEISSTPSKYTKKDFAKDVALSTGEVAAAYGILLTVGYTWYRIQERKNKKAATAS